MALCLCSTARSAQAGGGRPILLESHAAAPGPNARFYVDFLVRTKGFREIVEDTWLSKASSMLEPIGDGPWWGPLEDSQRALERMREVRARRKAREEGD